MYQSSLDEKLFTSGKRIPENFTNKKKSGIVFLSVRKIFRKYGSVESGMND